MTKQRVSRDRPPGIEREISVRVEPTPEEMAEMFCDMGDDEQARFLATAGKLSKEWEKHRDFQWSHVADRLVESGDRDAADLCEGLHEAIDFAAKESSP